MQRSRADGILPTQRPRRAQAQTATTNCVESRELEAPPRPQTPPSAAAPMIGSKAPSSADKSMDHLDSLRKRLVRALTELEAWSGVPQPGKALAAEIRLASTSVDFAEMKLHVHTAMHMIVDSGPMDEGFVPSLSEVADALDKDESRSRRR
jgi:hypothetical protein